MHRKTHRSREQLAAMQAARARNRMALPAPDYLPQLPELRRRIVITDYDFGEHIHTLDLYRTSRVDCYRVHVDGRPWKARIGWSKILEGLRKSLPRVGAD
jgi:hypothetical protein